MEVKADLVIIGGGQAGVCAGIAAAQEGKKVVLVQDRPMLGGNASSECKVPGHGAEAMSHNRNCRDGGILESMRLEYYLKDSPQSDTRNYWDLLLKKYCDKEKNLQLYMNTRAHQVEHSNGKITRVRASHLLKEENYEFVAPYFIDDTGDGWLAAQAGAAFRKGREAKSEFNEMIFGKDARDDKTLGCSIYGFAVKRDYPVSFQKPEWAKNYPDCGSLGHRPHDKSHLFPTITRSDDQRTLQFFWWLEWGGQLDVIKDIDEIYNHLLSELFGIWDHLKNSCTPETTEALKNFELESWSPFPLKRESRRVEGDYILNENDLFDPKLFEDRIGYGGWPLDDHPPNGVESADPGCDQVFLYEPYSVPYRSCYSRNVDNLFLVGRCISVTHGALASVRVMNTLGILGEAVGVAAALCLKYACTPRELGKRYMKELQQKILERDLYIIDMKNENPSNIAADAKVTVSSQRQLRGIDTYTGSIELKYDTAIQLPVSTSSVSSLKVRLASAGKTEVSWELYKNKTLSLVEGSPVASGKTAVEGDNWYDTITDTIPAGYGDVFCLVLKSNPGVEWYYGDELFQTRWGIKHNTPGDSEAYHGRARMAPSAREWTFINHNGRLTGDVVQWLETKPGKKVHGKLYVTPAFRIEPVQYPYGPENMINGITRAESWPNLWISGEGKNQNVLLEWTDEKEINKIKIIFDTQLDYSDQKYGFPRRDRDNTIPSCIEETVKSFVVEYQDGDAWKPLADENENIYRMWETVLERSVRTKKIRVTARDTWGAPFVSIYEVSVY